MKSAYAKSHEHAIQRGAQQADPEHVLALIPGAVQRRFAPDGVKISEIQVKKPVSTTWAGCVIAYLPQVRGLGSDDKGCCAASVGLTTPRRV